MALKLLLLDEAAVSLSKAGCDSNVTLNPGGFQSPTPTGHEAWGQIPWVPVLALPLSHYATMSR